MTITNLPADVEGLREIVGRMTVPNAGNNGRWTLGAGGRVIWHGEDAEYVIDCDRKEDAVGIVALRNNAMPIIDAQATRIAELEAALGKIASPNVLQSHGDPTVLRDYARAFLKGGNHD